MTTKKMTPTPRLRARASVKLEIELPVLSDEAAAAMADVLVQLYHRFEAQRALSIDATAPDCGNPQRNTELF
jgi:hypothetical protein